MKREDLSVVLWEQQKEFREEAVFVKRELVGKIISLLRLKLPLVITGVRRSGKSTLLRIIKKELRLKENEWLYINFNDERLLYFTVDDFQKILDYLQEREYRVESNLFIDEIQEVEHWEKWIDRIREKHSLFITGSNSKLLSKEIASVLTGRSLSLHLYPFSFREFLQARKIDYAQRSVDLHVQAKIRKEFAEYLKVGGFPKVVMEGDLRLLPELYENILYRDIVKRFNKNLEKAIKEISLYLLSNISKEFSLRTLSSLSGIKNLSTIKSVVDSFESAFLFFFVHKFDFSLKKQLLNPRKIYCVDNGFASEVGFHFSEEKGRMLENVVFLELKRREKDIYYFSEKKECDFVVREGTKIIEAIQVCHELTKENEEREIEGLLSALEKFKLREGLILTFDQSETRKIAQRKIHLVPVHKWLLKI